MDTQITMPKTKNRKNAGKNRAKRTPRSSGTNGPPRPLRNLPTSPNSTIRITRAIRRNFVIDSGSIDGVGATTMQLTFSPGATDYRFDGVSVYTTPVPNSAEFSALFDQWRLKGVVVRIDVPAAYSNSGATPILLPNIYFVSDYDDPQQSLIQDMLQYPQVQLHNFYKEGYTSFMVSLSPKPLRDIAGSGISTGYGPMAVAPWIRTADFSVPHYGLKLAFDWFGLTQVTDVPMVMTIWYELEFTNPK